MTDNATKKPIELSFDNTSLRQCERKRVLYTFCTTAYVVNVLGMMNYSLLGERLVTASAHWATISPFAAYLCLCFILLVPPVTIARSALGRYEDRIYTQAEEEHKAKIQRYLDASPEEKESALDCAGFTAS